MYFLVILKRQPLLRTAFDVDITTNDAGCASEPPFTRLLPAATLKAFDVYLKFFIKTASTNVGPRETKDAFAIA